MGRYMIDFFYYQYARNPSVQDRILQEIDEVLQANNQEFTYDSIQKMTYFEATLFGTLVKLCNLCLYV